MVNHFGSTTVPRHPRYSVMINLRYTIGVRFPGEDEPSLLFDSSQFKFLFPFNTHSTHWIISLRCRVGASANQCCTKLLLLSRLRLAAAGCPEANDTLCWASRSFERQEASFYVSFCCIVCFWLNRRFRGPRRCSKYIRHVQRVYIKLILFQT